LNKDIRYLTAEQHLEWMPDAIAAVAFLRRAEFLVFVVTNQSGVARGFYTESAVQTLHESMQRQLLSAGGGIEEFVYCPHHPESADPKYRVQCECRKPAPGMLLGLMAKYPIKRGESFLIGDKQSDLAAAAAAGVTGYLYEGGSLLQFVKKLIVPSP
jgi:D-glycero-D-manno-heptose 1,7-bisphosphate phosphatase